MCLLLDITFMLKFVRLLIAGLFNTLSASPTNWSNTLKQFVGKLPTNCLSVSEHFLGLALKGLSKYWPLTTIKFLHQTTPCRLQNDSKTKKHYIRTEKKWFRWNWNCFSHVYYIIDVFRCRPVDIYLIQASNTGSPSNFTSTNKFE